jgi:hypothetical protein
MRNGKRSTGTNCHDVGRYIVKYEQKSVQNTVPLFWVNCQNLIRILVAITPEGWNEIEKSIHNVYSRQVFIAMHFSPEMHPAREANKKSPWQSPKVDP